METEIEPVTVKVSGSSVSSSEQKSLTDVLRGLRDEASVVYDEIKRIKAEEDARTRPLYDRLKQIQAREEEIRSLLDEPPACFGTRTDLDLPICEVCRKAALCYKAMKAKGLI